MPGCKIHMSIIARRHQTVKERVCQFLPIRGFRKKEREPSKEGSQKIPGQLCPEVRMGDGDEGPGPFQNAFVFQVRHAVFRDHVLDAGAGVVTVLPGGSWGTILERRAPALSR